MMYYVKNNVLFCCENIITDKNFIPITEEEYTQRLETATNLREKGNLRVEADSIED